MKIDRWIYVPLIFALTFGLCFGFLSPGNPYFGLISGFISGAIVGFILQLWGDARTKKISQTMAETDFSVQQMRKIVLLSVSNKVFDLCKDSIVDLGAKIKFEDHESGLIKAETKMNFYTFGTEITFDLKPINENFSEVNILTRPVLKTTIVDYGESLRVIEDICNYLKAKDSEINNKLLVESVGILEEIYLKPFQKEKA